MQFVSSDIQLVNSNIQFVNSNIQLINSNILFFNLNIQFVNPNIPGGNFLKFAVIQIYLLAFQRDVKNLWQRSEENSQRKII